MSEYTTEHYFSENECWHNVGNDKFYLCTTKPIFSFNNIELKRFQGNVHKGFFKYLKAECSKSITLNSLIQCNNNDNDIYNGDVDKNITIQPLVNGGDSVIFKLNGNINKFDIDCSYSIPKDLDLHINTCNDFSLIHFGSDERYAPYIINNSTFLKSYIYASKHTKTQTEITRCNITNEKHVGDIYGFEISCNNLQHGAVTLKEDTFKGDNMLIKNQEGVTVENCTIEECTLTIEGCQNVRIENTNNVIQ